MDARSENSELNSPKPHVLITNDDGISSPGLLALKDALFREVDVTVLAPAKNRSASGHAKTMHKPLRVDEVTLADGTPAMATDGAPSDAVALALMGLAGRSVDLVVSGINYGANLGHDVTYSGTVTAAMEGVIGGVPSVAVSLSSYTYSDFSVAGRIAAGVVQKALTHGLPSGVLLNVNVPPVPEHQIAGVLVTRAGHRIYQDELVIRTDPRGRPYYWIGGMAPTGVEEEGTDIWAVAHNYVSITPLQLDMTAYDALDELRSWAIG